MIPLGRRPISIIRWWRRSNAQSAVGSRVVPAVVPRVVECAGWGSAVISTASCSCAASAAVALVWSVIVSLRGGCGGGLVVVWARGAGAWRTGCGRVLRHHRGSLVPVNIERIEGLEGRNGSGSACIGSLSGLNPLLNAMVGSSCCGVAESQVAGQVEG